MPTTLDDNKRRQKLSTLQRLEGYTLVVKKEIDATPAAQEAMAKEWEALQDLGVWDET